MNIFSNLAKAQNRRNKHHAAVNKKIQNIRTIPMNKAVVITTMPVDTIVEEHHLLNNNNNNRLLHKCIDHRTCKIE
jgi:hypothetical protein